MQPPQEWITIQQRIHALSQKQKPIIENNPQILQPSTKSYPYDNTHLEDLRRLLFSQETTPHEKITEVLYNNEIPILSPNRYTTKNLVHSCVNTLYESTFTAQHKDDCIGGQSQSCDDKNPNNTDKFSNPNQSPQLYVGGFDMTAIPYSAIQSLHRYVHEREKQKTQVTPLSPYNTISPAPIDAKLPPFSHPTDPKLFNSYLLTIDPHVLLAEPDPIVFFDNHASGEVSTFAICCLSIFRYPGNDLVLNHVYTTRLQAPYISSFFAFKESPPLLASLVDLHLCKQSLQYYKLPSLKWMKFIKNGCGNNRKFSQLHCFFSSILPFLSLFSDQDLNTIFGPLLQLSIPAPSLTQIFPTISQITQVPFPDIISTDSNGTLHQYKAGLAVHIAVLTQIPTFGVAKSAYTANGVQPKLSLPVSQLGGDLARGDDRSRGQMSDGVTNEKSEQNGQSLNSFLLDSPLGLSTSPQQQQPISEPVPAPVCDVDGKCAPKSSSQLQDFKYCPFSNICYINPIDNTSPTSITDNNTSVSDPSPHCDSLHEDSEELIVLKKTSPKFDKKFDKKMDKTIDQIITKALSSIHSILPPSLNSSALPPPTSPISPISSTPGCGDVVVPSRPIVTRYIDDQVKYLLKLILFSRWYHALQARHLHGSTSDGDLCDGNNNGNGYFYNGTDFTITRAQLCELALNLQKFAYSIHLPQCFNQFDQLATQQKAEDGRVICLSDFIPTRSLPIPISSSCDSSDDDDNHGDCDSNDGNEQNINNALDKLRKKQQSTHFNSPKFHPVKLQSFPWFPLIDDNNQIRGISLDSTSFYRIVKFRAKKKPSKNTSPSSSSSPTAKPLQIRSPISPLSPISTPSLPAYVGSESPSRRSSPSKNGQHRDYSLLDEVNPVFISTGIDALLPLEACVKTTFITSHGNKVPSPTAEADNCSRMLTRWVAMCVSKGQFEHLLRE